MSPSDSSESHTLKLHSWRARRQGIPQNKSAGTPLSGEIATPLPTGRAQSPTNDRIRRTAARRSGVFHVEARFEGLVLELQNETIIAYVTDKEGRSSEFLTVEIPVQDVSPYDRPLATPGATFYWLIGFEEKPYWQRSLILTFAGHRKLQASEIHTREQGLLELLDEDPGSVPSG